MKITILTTFYWTVQGRHALAGEVIDVDDELGWSLIEAGYAQKGGKAAKAPKDKAQRATEDK
jgi:hypothetical protein